MTHQQVDAVRAQRSDSRGPEQTEDEPAIFEGVRHGEDAGTETTFYQVQQSAAGTATVEKITVKGDGRVGRRKVVPSDPRVAFKSIFRRRMRIVITIVHDNIIVIVLTFHATRWHEGCALRKPSDRL